MTTINAQTIICEVMAAHANAPTKADAGFSDKIKFKTSARGFHTIHNSKENLQRFADLVKKNARAFGGGLIKEEKQRQAVTYATKTISLFKQLIEDQDYSAALALADEKLSPLFFMGGKGVAAMLVAPEVFEQDARLITGMTERGTWSVTEVVSMQSLNGFSVINKRSRNAQIDYVMARYNGITEEKRTLAIETAHQKPEDQAASRAAWIAQHGLPGEAIEARIESEDLQHEEEKPLGLRFDEDRAKRKAAREAAAVQDVAQVLATAQAMAAIQQASTPAQAQSQPEAGELVTCEAGDNEAQGVSMGNATGNPAPWAPVAQYVPTNASQIYSGLPVPPAFRGGDGETADNTTPPAGKAQDAANDYENRKTIAFKSVKIGDAFQFSKNGMVFVKSRGGYRPGRGGDLNTLYPDYMVFSYDPAWGMKSSEAQADAAQQAQAAAAEASQAASEETALRDDWLTTAHTQRITSKSGAWNAWLFMTTAGLFGLAFSRHGQTAQLTAHATTRARLDALQAMASAADAPTDTPTPPAPPAPDFEPAGDLGQASTPEQTPTVPQSETPRDLEADQAEAVAVDFERVEPIRVDLAALIIKGVRPDDLVGMGVYCKGDRANPSGSGAITGFSHSDFYGLVVDVALEGGQVWRAVRTSEFKDGWFSLNAKMHGAPYLAELAMGAALAKSKDTSAKELAKQAHAQALIDLAAQFPQLKRAENTHAGGKLAAANMRVLLKAAFKGVKFSVTSTYSSARIVWTDGPTDAQVQAVIGRFDIGASDTQSDYFYTVDTAFSQLFGGVQYMTTRREETDALIQEAIDKAFENSMEKPALADWKNGKNEMSWGDWKRRKVNEALNTISKA
jgi:hypothetical protein